MHMHDHQSGVAHFDLRTLERLDLGSKALQSISDMPLHMLRVGQESGFPDHASELQDVGTSRNRREANVGLSLPLSAQGVPWIERYIIERITPLCADSKSKNQLSEQFQVRELRLYTAGAVWGQCVAQELGLHWIENHLDANRPWLHTTDYTRLCGVVDPWEAVREFADFGEQASLVVQLNALRNQPSNTALIIRVNEWMRANIRQEILGEIHTEQRWHTRDGELEAITYLDVDGREIRRIELQRRESNIEFNDVMSPSA
jgi:hypothetical protein